MFHFSRQRIHWQTWSNIIRDMTGQKQAALLLSLGLDMSPPHWYQWIRGGEALKKKHIRLPKESEQAQTKGAQHAKKLWQLIKALTLNIAVINYAEGSIVCFLPLSSSDHGERFKDLVGGGSCRLSFLSAASTSPSPLVSQLCLAFWDLLVFISPLSILLCALSLATELWKQQ